MFAVTMRVLSALHDDPVWSKRALACRSVEALQNVVVEFAKEKGIAVKDLDADLAAPEVAS
jgi:hypothetical protein